MQLQWWAEYSSEKDLNLEDTSLLGLWMEEQILKGELCPTGSQRVGHDWATNTFTFHDESQEKINQAQCGQILGVLNFLILSSVSLNLIARAWHQNAKSWAVMLQYDDAKGQAPNTTARLTDQKRCWWSPLCYHCLPGNASGREFACQCKRHGFHP